MKFAHSFSQVLEGEGFPADWKAAAIHYRQLKKYIKKVQQELSELGLTVDILKSLVQQSAASLATGGDQPTKQRPLFQYMFDGETLL